MSEVPPYADCRLVVAIPTYRRPESLLKVLGKLGDRAAELPDRYTVEAIVVDNDPAGSAQYPVAHGNWDVPVRYVHEPTPGIAAARRRLLSEASGHHLLAFIDDDEWPLPGWLSELVSMWEITGAAAVLGSVETVLPEGTDPWVAEFGIFDRAGPSPGQHLAAAATNNLLLDLVQVRELGVDFDVSLGLRGGEDTLITRQMVALGASIVGCPASVVRDDLDPERATREFTVRRARYHGTTQADIDLRIAENRAERLISRLRSTAKGCVWIVLGALQGMRGALRRSLTDSAWSVRRIQRGIGLLQGAWGSPPGEYQRSADKASKEKRRHTRP